MKQVKFFLVALMAAVMGVSVSSCMNGDDNDGKQTFPALVEVSSYMGISYSFKVVGGDYTIKPTTTALSLLENNGIKLSSVKMAYIYYTFDPAAEINLNYQTSKEIVADLEYFVSLDNPVEVVDVKGAENDSVADASIRRIANIIGSENFYLINNKLVMGVDYFMSNKQHFTSLVCYMDEMQGEDLVLYLRHNINGDDKSTSATSYDYSQNGYIPFYFKSFDISNAVSYFYGKTSNYPKKVIIKASVDMNSLTLKKDEELTSYSISYTAK